MVNERVEAALEEKLPEIIRALGIHEAEEETGEEYGDVLAVARLLGRDLSSPEKVRAAKKHVYNLARKGAIPSVRVTERCVRFDLDKVRKSLADKSEHAQAA